MKKLILASILTFLIMFISNNSIAAEYKDYSYDTNMELINFIGDINNKDKNVLQLEIGSTVNSGTFVYCKCAYVNLGWLGRQIGIGNRLCLARNIGSICHSGEDVECQERNTNCGGQNPDPGMN